MKADGCYTALVSSESVTDICGLAGQKYNCDGIISVEKNMEEINGN